MSRFRLINSYKMLDRYNREVIRNSHHEGVMLGESYADMKFPILIYAYVDIPQPTSRRGNMPFVRHCILARRHAKRLVYFRTEDQGIAVSDRQLVLNSDIFEAFIEKLRTTQEMLYKFTEQNRAAASERFERYIEAMRAAYADWSSLLFVTVQRRFQYSYGDDRREYYDLPYCIHLDPDSAARYVYRHKNSKATKQKTPEKSPDKFQNYVHSIFGLQVPGPTEKSNLKKRRA